MAHDRSSSKDFSRCYSVSIQNGLSVLSRNFNRINQNRYGWIGLS